MRKQVLLQCIDRRGCIGGRTELGQKIRGKLFIRLFFFPERRDTDEVAHWIAAQRIDEAWLSDLESRDNLFPSLDFREYMD